MGLFHDRDSHHGVKVCLDLVAPNTHLLAASFRIFHIELKISLINYSSMERLAMLLLMIPFQEEAVGVAPVEL